MAAIAAVEASSEEVAATEVVVVVLGGQAGERGVRKAANLRVS